MSDQWTIESICEALGNPVAAQRFLTEINRAPAHDLLPTFARWQGIAQDTLNAVERGRQIHAALERGEEIPGEVDGTVDLLKDADRFRSQGAA
ncbi:hypothetical protein ACFVIM_01440 [Streptomyces sp. NPDC057638]|uniref:hypothetical protein n=1 Tax=Streptomyces sp. NPDC057638 TaxID=3346190 RepID=UPI003682F76D